ncbi:MAG: amidohydrolase [Acholeplasmatales bacterium]|nr:amidohydrolase [Acholeplasmatales bacterium]
MKKIDCHVHLMENLHGIGAKGYLRDLGNGCGQYENGEIVRIIPEGFGNKVTAEDFIKIMDQNDVEFCIVLQSPYGGVQNLFTAEAMKKYPNRILGAAMYDPFSRQKESIRNYLFDELGFKIIKMEMSNTSGIMCNHDTVDLDGDLMNDVYKHANEHGLIFFMDIGRPGNDCYQIEHLRNAILKYPDMTFVICHLTAPQHDNKDILINNMNMLKLKNVYFDIASLYNNVKDPYPFLETQDYLRTAIDIVGSDKILWGTDFPSAMKNTTYKDSYTYILESEILSEEEKENILYNNAYRLFKKLL